MDVLLEIFRCPRSGQEMRVQDGRLVTFDGRFAYRIENGIPVLLAEEAVEVMP